MRTLNRLLLLGLLATMPVVTLAADDAPSADPEVTIRTEGDKTIQEYRQNGFLYAIKITPKTASLISWYAPMALMAISFVPTSRTC